MLFLGSGLGNLPTCGLWVSHDRSWRWYHSGVLRPVVVRGSQSLAQAFFFDYVDTERATLYMATYAFFRELVMYRVIIQGDCGEQIVSHARVVVEKHTGMVGPVARKYYCSHG